MRKSYRVIAIGTDRRTWNRRRTLRRAAEREMKRVVRAVSR